MIDYTGENFDEQAALNNYYRLLANPMQFNKLIHDRYDCIIACNHNAPSYFASYIKGGAKILWIRGDMRELDYTVLDENTDQYKQVKQEHKIINELPVTLECELKEIIGGSKYIGKIVNVSVDERVLGEDGKINLDKFHPIIFDGTTAGYYAFGERVGNAFKDGAKLK